MAKTSMIAREHKRTKTVEKFAAKRAAIKAVLNDANAVSYTHLTLPTNREV